MLRKMKIRVDPIKLNRKMNVNSSPASVCELNCQFKRVYASHKIHTQACNTMIHMLRIAIHEQSTYHPFLSMQNIHNMYILYYNVMFMEK